MDVTDLHFELRVRGLELRSASRPISLGCLFCRKTPAMNLLAIRVRNSRISKFAN